jgi:FtsZ-interacting cell division protein ZipA
MDQTTTIVIVVVAIALIIVVAGLLIARKRRSDHLKHQFGPEYDRAIKQHGDARHAETVLLQREKRVEKFSLHPLPPIERERYAEEWSHVQRRFVDDPSTAVLQAEKLVTTVMTARGYPMGDFEQRAADISVHYPRVVDNYRRARELTIRHASGQSSTEDLRQSMVYFRSLFDELLESHQTQKIEVTHERIAS